MSYYHGYNGIKNILDSSDFMQKSERIASISYSTHNLEGIKTIMTGSNVTDEDDVAKRNIEKLFRNSILSW